MLNPPPLHRPVAGVDKLLEVERIVRDATWAGESPLSLNEVKRRMAQKNPRHSQVRDLVDTLVYLGRVTDTGHGIEFTYLDPGVADALDTVAL